MMTFLSLLFRLLKVILILILPFMALIRGAVYVHSHYHTGPYLSLAFGILFSVFVLVLYSFLVYGPQDRTTGGPSIAFGTRAKLFGFVVVGFCIHGLFFMSSENMSSSKLDKSIRQLHPIIRIAVSTIVVMDRDLIITDGSRTPEDYQKMGLPTKKTSLHYRQKDGYAYALDLRTNRRSAVRNQLVRSYFWLMGFRTLRHVGTDDHLHVSLYCHELPRSY